MSFIVFTMIWGLNIILIVYWYCKQYVNFYEYLEPTFYVSINKWQSEPFFHFKTQNDFLLHWSLTSTTAQSQLKTSRLNIWKLFFYFFSLTAKNLPKSDRKQGRKSKKWKRTVLQLNLSHCNSLSIYGASTIVSKLLDFLSYFLRQKVYCCNRLRLPQTEVPKNGDFNSRLRLS